MPPFSSDTDHHAQHYHIHNGSNGHLRIDSGARPLAVEGKEFLGRRHIDEEYFSPGVSFLNGEFRGFKVHRHFWRPSSQLEAETEEKDDAEANDEFEFDPVLDAAEDNEVSVEHHHQLACNSFHTQFSTSSIGSTTVGLRNLFTIPERRVSFAGKVFGNILMDDLQVQLIPHVQEYSTDEKLNMWYTRAEFKAMRKSCFHTARIVSTDAELNCPYFIRGLEHIVEQYRQYSNEKDGYKVYEGIGSNGRTEGMETEDEEIEIERCLDDCCDSISTSESRRWDAVEAVLLEQERQRRVMLETYGIVYGGITEPEKIRSVYTMEGETKTSLSIARIKAMNDEACAKEWLTEQKNPTNIQPESELYYTTADADHHESDNCGNGLSKNIRRSFQKLLTPFLDIRDGDIYSELGDEYFLAHP